MSRIPLLATASRRQRRRVHGASRLQGQHVFRSGLLFFFGMLYCINCSYSFMLVLWKAARVAFPSDSRAPPHTHTLVYAPRVHAQSRFGQPSLLLSFLSLASCDDIHVEVLFSCCSCCRRRTSSLARSSVGCTPNPSSPLTYDAHSVLDFGAPLRFFFCSSADVSFGAPPKAMLRVYVSCVRVFVPARVCPFRVTSNPRALRVLRSTTMSYSFYRLPLFWSVGVRLFFFLFV